MGHVALVVFFRNWTFEFKMPLGSILYPLGNVFGTQENNIFQMNFSVLWFLMCYRVIQRFKGIVLG